MYLRTQFAWYILDSPSSLYSSFFTPFWTQHRILHLVVTSSLDNRRITFDQFISSLQVTPLTSDSIAISMKMLGRELNKEDVESDEVVSAFSLFCHTNGLLTITTEILHSCYVGRTSRAKQYQNQSGTSRPLTVRRGGHICGG